MVVQTLVLQQFSTRWAGAECHMLLLLGLHTQMDSTWLHISHCVQHRLLRFGFGCRRNLRSPTLLHSIPYKPTEQMHTYILRLHVARRHECPGGWEAYRVAVAVDVK